MDKHVQLDLTEELGLLLIYIADVATAIRLHSAYTGGNPYGALPVELYPTEVPPQQQSLNDVMWLSDSLHNFDRLGRAIQEQSTTKIVAACDMLIQQYQELYIVGKNGLKSDPKTTFDLHAHLVPLADAIAIFETIKSKAVLYEVKK